MSDGIITAVVYCEDRAKRAGNARERKSFVLLAQEYRKLARERREAVRVLYAEETGCIIGEAERCAK